MNLVKFTTVVFLTIGLLLLSSLSAVSASDSKAQLSFNKGVLSCLGTENNDTLSINNCMNFDLVKIGDSQASVVALLGNPARLVAGVDSADIGIYPLTQANPGDDPYLLVTIKNGLVSTLMLQGRGTTDQLTFSGLHLGDSTNVVVALLGPASGVFSDPNSGADLWQYEPNPFSLEIEKGKLVSIQIWNLTSPKETKTE